MAADPLVFPEFPYNGQVHAHAGRTWVYDSNIPAWKPQKGPAVLDPAVIARRSNRGFTVTVRNTAKNFDANTATLDNTIDTLATLIHELKLKEII